MKVNDQFQNKLIIICGASAGIGLETTRILFRMGANICLIARNREPLQNAKDSLFKENHSENQFIEIITCDSTDMDRLKPLLEVFISNHGCPDYLINAVGFALPHYIQDLTLQDFKNNMNVNYFGELIPTLIVLPHMIEKKGGHIAFISSMMGYFGIMGYATYAPSKFAVTGLAEVLRHELKPYHINISVLFPPDTNTPGFEKENQTKPEECRMLSETIKPLEPQVVAQAFVKGILKRQFSILPGGSKSTWRLFRFFPGFVHWFLDHDLAKARKRLGKI